MNSSDDHDADRRPEPLPRIARPLEFLAGVLCGVELLREVVRKFLPTLLVTFFDGDARRF